LLVRGERFRQQRGDFPHLLAHSAHALQDAGGELGAFARARRHQLVERAAAKRGHRAAQAFLVGVLADHARPAQEVGDAQRRRLGEGLFCRVGERAQPLERFGVEPRRGLGRPVGQRKPAIDLAASDAGGDQLAQGRLVRAQLVGDAELQIEEARIDRTQLEAQRSTGRTGRRRGVAGHALNGKGQVRGAIIG
jgi:hypothetical protein